MKRPVPFTVRLASGTYQVLAEVELASRGRHDVVVDLWVSRDGTALSLDDVASAECEYRGSICDADVIEQELVEMALDRVADAEAA